jgi:hypothetical protein
MEGENLDWKELRMELRMECGSVAWFLHDSTYCMFTVIGKGMQKLFFDALEHCREVASRSFAPLPMIAMTTAWSYIVALVYKLPCIWFACVFICFLISIHPSKGTNQRNFCVDRARNYAQPFFVV